MKLSWSPEKGELCRIVQVNENKVKIDVKEGQKAIIIRESQAIEVLTKGKYKLKDMEHAMILWLPEDQIKLRWGIPAKMGLKDVTGLNVGMCGIMEIDVNNYLKFISSFPIDTRETIIKREALRKIARECITNAVRKILPGMKYDEFEKSGISEVELELERLREIGLYIHRIEIWNHVEY